ncbi:MAG: hypothetical protein PVH61_06145 [Candidatus Aminicenantes bacterium]|jgi:hypothetical protein
MMKNKNLRKISYFLINGIVFLSIISIKLMLSPLPAGAEEGTRLFATSAGLSIASGRTYIVLYWNDAEGVTGYNLYRKDREAQAYPKVPLNGSTPIVPAADCNQLKAIIPQDSKEWQLMANAFAAAYVKGKTGIEEITPPDLGQNKKALPKKNTNLQIQKIKVRAKEFALKKQVKSQLQMVPGIKQYLLEHLDKSAYLCNAFNRGLNDKEQAIFDMLALTNLRCRLARGLAYIDSAVAVGAEYEYELRGVDAEGQERVLDTGVWVKAGTFVLPDPPTGLTVTPGDSRVLCTWNRLSRHYSYAVGRSTALLGTYYAMNEEPVVFDIETDLEGAPLPEPKPGFLDFRRWDDQGSPTTHEVKGHTIAGPINNHKYYYKVACVDILGRQGAWSTSRMAVPRDSTAPSAPGDFRIDVSPSSPSLILTWKKSTRDVKGHVEGDTAHTYYIYRADTLQKLEDIVSLSSYQVTSLTADPTDANIVELTWTDSAGVLVPPFGEKDFYYRLRCKDAANNLSAPSAAISGRVPDTTPPGPTQVVETKGYSDRIEVSWQPNHEPDLAGYQIYRGVCDQGRPFRPPDEVKVTDRDPRLQTYPCDYLLVGQVLLEQAKEMLDTTGRIYFSDDSVPEGSPICYSYWVRAFDESRNLYEGEYLCPKEGEHLCQKLYEETPPPVPIIAGMKARSNSMQLRWISSPVQDLRCFHVYRSFKESEPGVFVACVKPDGTSSPTRWAGIETPSCVDIPAEPDPTSVSVSFTDTNLEPNRIYWYRISALDWLGNESEGDNLTNIPAISTFTYSKQLPVKPVILPPASTPGAGCERVVRWNPVYDAARLKGFIVFRSSKVLVGYRQVSGIVAGNEFIDNSAFEGKEYWYRVQSMDLNGKLSPPSLPVKH